MREPNFLRGKNKASYTLFNTYYFYLACYVDILGDFCGRDSELSWCINEVGVYLPELYWWPQAHIIFPFLVFNTVRIYQHSGVIAVVENLEVFFCKILVDNDGVRVEQPNYDNHVRTRFDQFKIGYPACVGEDTTNVRAGRVYGKKLQGVLVYGVYISCAWQI